MVKYSMRTGEIVKINVPAILLAAGALVAGLVAWRTHGVPRVALIVVAWWCAAGAMLVFADYRRKARIFMRLVSTGATGRNVDRTPSSGPIGAYLNSTICGRCILWAVHGRMRSVRNST